MGEVLPAQDRRGGGHGLRAVLQAKAVDRRQLDEVVRQAEALLHWARLGSQAGSEASWLTGSRSLEWSRHPA